MSKAAIFRDEVARLDLVHRKGWRLSEGDNKWPNLASLNEEVNELGYALINKDLENAKEETADVFVTLLQIASRLGMTFEELDELAVHKMRIRFNGAETIVI